MTDVYHNELRIYKNKKKTKELRKATAKWVHGFKPTDFISIQFPTKQRSKSLDTSLKHLKTVMKYFESSRIILSDELFMKDKTISPYKEKTVHNT